MPKKPKIHSRVILQDDDEIFPTKVIEFTVTKGDSTADRYATLDAWWTAIAGQDQSPLDHHLADNEAAFTAYLKSRGIPTDWPVPGLNRHQPDTLLAAKPADKRDQLAREVLIRIKLLRDAIQKRDARAAAVNAICFAQACVKFNVLPHSRNARSGRKSNQGAQKGAIGKHGSLIQRQQRYAVYQQRVDKLHRDNPRRTHWDICQTVAKDIGVNPKTIKRHTVFK